MSADTDRFVDWLARELAARGTRFAFGVPGGGVTLDLLAATQATGIRTVITAREDAAAMMAGVAARLAGGPGLAFSTKGPGLASATNGLASALLDRMPVMFAAEGFDSQELKFLSHQVFDQAALGRALFGEIAGGKAQVLTPEVSAVSAALDSMTRAPMGPALLLADPVLMTSPVPEVGATPPSSPLSEMSALRNAQELIASARRPVIVAGLEATTVSAAKRVRELASVLGAPVLVTYMAKGVVPDQHPNFAGIFTGGAIEQRCVGAADLIILAGLDPVELIRKPWPYNAPVVDLCAQRHNPHYMRPKAIVEGELSATLKALVEGLGPTDWNSSDPSDFYEAFRGGMAMPEGNQLTADRVVKAVGQAFDFAPRVSVDAGAHMFSACASWQACEPLDLLISNGLASMGFALPAGIAAALHDPERGAIAMTGDGGLLMCLGELKTAAEMNANLTVVVFNDACLSLIDIKRKQRQMQNLGLAWSAPDFASVAEGFGFKTWRAYTPAAMEAAASAAASTDGPRLIDARIDPSAYGAQLQVLRG